MMSLWVAVAASAVLPQSWRVVLLCALLSGCEPPKSYGYICNRVDEQAAWALQCVGAATAHRQGNESEGGDIVSECRNSARDLYCIWGVRP